MPICGAAFFTDFTSCMDGFTAGKANSDPGVSNPTWACGDPTSGPVGAIGVWATNLDGSYAPDESAYLEAPPIDLSNCGGNSVFVEIVHWYDIENNFDGGNFQVSIDGGQTWDVVPALGHWYDTNDLGASFVPPAGQPGFTSGDMTWRTSIVDLGPYLGEADVRFRFVFGSDASVQYDGWYIDSYEVIVQ